MITASEGCHNRVHLPNAVQVLGTQVPSPDLPGTRGRDAPVKELEVINVTCAPARFRAFPDDTGIALNGDKPVARVGPILKRTGNRSFGSTPSSHPRSARCFFGPSPRGRACANSRYRSHTRRRARDGLPRSDRARPKKRESRSLAPPHRKGSGQTRAAPIGLTRRVYERPPISC